MAFRFSLNATAHEAVIAGFAATAAAAIAAAPPCYRHFRAGFGFLSSYFQLGFSSLPLGKATSDTPSVTALIYFMRPATASVHFI